MGVKVRERPKDSGVFWVFIDHKGKRTAKRVGGEKAALKARQQIEARLTLGKSAFEEPAKTKDVPTVEQYFEKFQRNYLNTAVRSTTQISYSGSFKNHILPELGKCQLDEITRSRVKDFVAKLVDKQTIRFNKKAQRTVLESVKQQWPDRALQARRLIREFDAWLKSNSNLTEQKAEDNLRELLGRRFEGMEADSQDKARSLIMGSVQARKMARPSIRIILAELCAMLNSAIEDEIITDNPAKRLSKFYKQAPILHEEIQPLTHGEVPLFLQSARKYSPECYPIFLCAIHTGLRSGELAGLTWGDIDFNGKFLTVRKNIVRGRIHATKTDKTRRVDMSDALIAELLNLKRQRREEWLSRGKNEIPEWVFCNREGNPADMHNVKNRHFSKCLEKAGLRQIRFHDLRHSFSSLLLQDGQSLKYVSDQLGHSSIKMTADVYGHLVPGANRQAVNRLPSINSPGAARTAAEA